MQTRLAAASLGIVGIATLVGATLPSRSSSATSRPTYLATVEQRGTARPSRIELLDGHGAVVRVVSRTTEIPFPTTEPRWSPDRALIAWIDAAGLSVERVDGTGRRLLVASGGAFVWSPDGRFVLAATKRRRLVVVNVASGAKRVVIRASQAVDDYNPLGWSPDGAAIAYGVYNNDTGAARIVIDTPAGGAPRTLFTFAAAHDFPGFVSWSPDGRRLALMTDANVLPDPEFALIDTRSGAMRRLTRIKNPCEWAPAWSPDGSRLAVAAPCGVAGGRVVTFSVTGDDVRPLGAGLDVSWQPDGRLYVLSGDETHGMRTLSTASSWTRAPRLVFRLPKGQSFASFDASS